MKKIKTRKSKKELMMRYSTMKHFYLLALSVTFMTSCNMKGGHRTVSYDGSLSIDKNDSSYSIVINRDSLETTNKHISDSITLKEHRVYYVDYSYSMRNKKYKDKDGNTLLDLVKKHLKKSIREIKGENVFIEIIPFLDAELWQEKGSKPSKIFQITKKKTFATKELQEMDAFIDEIEAIKRSDGTDYNTHHSIVINDFLHNRINDNKYYHMMVLLTDGIDESHEQNLPTGANILDNEWATSTNSKYVFGIFANVLENKELTDELPNRFKGKDNEEKRRFYKKGLNFNFNVCILKQPDVVEHRKHNIVYIPVGGTMPVFIDTIQQDRHYKYTMSQPVNQSPYLKIRVDTLTPAQERPNINNYKFQLRYNQQNDSQFFLSHQEIDLCVIDEKTPNIKFIIPNQANDSLPCVSQEFEYCKKLFGFLEPEWSDTLTIKIMYEKSNDAKYDEKYNDIKLRISNLPDYVTLISGNEYCLNKPSDTLSIVLTLNHSSAELCDDLTINGYLEVIGAEDLKEVFVNKMPLDYINSSMTIGSIKIKTDKQWHPLLIILIIIFLSLVALWLIAMACIKGYRASRPRIGIPALQFSTDPPATGLNLNPNHIIFANILEGYSTEFIRSVRYDTNVVAYNHTKVWGIHNWWRLRLALSGDVHEYHLDPNVFADVIELKPTYQGIEVYVDNQYKCTINILDESKKIQEYNNNNLVVTGYKPVHSVK